MPRKYKRKFQRKRRYNVGSALSTASKALTVAYGIKKLLNVERKYHDGAVDGGSANSTMVINTLTTIPQGDTANTRDGYSLKLQNLAWRLFIKQNASATTPTQVRVMIVQGLDDTAASQAFLLESTGSAPLDMRNIYYTNELKVLYDKVLNVGPNGSASAGVYRNGFIKRFPSEHLTFDQADTAGTSIRKGALFMCIIGDNATNAPSYDFTYRIRYVDN